MQDAVCRVQRRGGPDAIHTLILENCASKRCAAFVVAWIRAAQDLSQHLPGYLVRPVTKQLDRVVSERHRAEQYLDLPKWLGRPLRMREHLRDVGDDLRWPRLVWRVPELIDDVKSERVAPVPTAGLTSGLYGT